MLQFILLIFVHFVNMFSQKYCTDRPVYDNIMLQQCIGVKESQQTRLEQSVHDVTILYICLSHLEYYEFILHV